MGLNIPSFIKTAIVFIDSAEQIYTDIHDPTNKIHAFFY